MIFVTGDSLAVGIAPYVHERVVDAAVGRASRAGLRAILGRRNAVLLVSLGANDADRDPRFVRRVRAALVGRRCVAWLAPSQRPHLRSVLRSAARADARLRIVSMRGVRLSDGVHPDPSGYRVLAGRMTSACQGIR